MQHYEITILVHPNQSERIQDITRKYKTLIESENGKIHKFDDLGKKQLSYQIKKLHKAHYILMNVECTKKTLNNLSASFKFNDAIIRSLILKNEKFNTDLKIKHTV